MTESKKINSLQNRIKMLEEMAAKRRMGAESNTTAEFTQPNTHPIETEQSATLPTVNIEEDIVETSTSAFSTPEVQTQISNTDSLSDYFKAIGISDTLQSQDNAESTSFSLDDLLNAPSEDIEATPVLDTYEDDLDAPMDPFAGKIDTSREQVIAEMHAEELAILTESTEELAVEETNKAPEEDGDSLLDYLWDEEAQQINAATDISEELEADLGEENTITYNFDEERTHVIMQMAHDLQCDPEDIIVTALDWYIEALKNENAA